MTTESKTTSPRPRRAPDPAPAHASAANLKARVRELEDRLRARRKERQALERASTRGLTDAQLEEREQRQRLLGLQVRREEEELAAAERELKAAKAREAEEDDRRFAEAARQTLLDQVTAAEQAIAEAQRRTDAVNRAVTRAREVRKHLRGDPFEGLYGRLVKLCPTIGWLAELEREGRSLVEIPSSERWPRLIFDAAGGAHYEDLERIRTAADFREWCALGHQALPSGSEASRQRAELANRFGR